MTFWNSRYFYFLVFENEIIIVNRLTLKIDSKRFIDQRISSSAKMVDLTSNNFLLMVEDDVLQLTIIDELKSSWTHLIRLRRCH